MCMGEETWVCFTDLEESLEDFEGTNKQLAFSFISIPVLQSIALSPPQKIKPAHCLN